MQVEQLQKSSSCTRFLRSIRAASNHARVQGDAQNSSGTLIKLKRVYETAETSDGYRVLVDRLWSRGVKKSDAKLDEWLRDLAPSTGVRNWFKHDPKKWPEFQRRYRAELNTKMYLLQKLITDALTGISRWFMHHVNSDTTM